MANPEVTAFIDSLGITPYEIEAQERGLYISEFISPENAQKYFREKLSSHRVEDWEDFALNGRAHHLRAEAIIALGSVSRIKQVISLNLRAIDDLNGVLNQSLAVDLDIFRKTPAKHTAAYIARVNQA